MGMAYSFMKYGQTGEIHIFEGLFHLDKSCDANTESVCKKIKLHQGKWYDDAICLNDKKARKVAAKLGKEVCGECVSRLYTAY